MTWTARNIGLTGTALNANYVTQNPLTRHLGSAGHELLLATDDGLYHAIDGLTWGKIALPDPSNAEFSDDPAATVDELTFHWVDYDPLDAITVYTLAAKASVSRLWIYKSTDNLITWISRGITIG